MTHVFQIEFLDTQDFEDADKDARLEALGDEAVEIARRLGIQHAGLAVSLKQIEYRDLVMVR